MMPSTQHLEPSTRQRPLIAIPCGTAAREDGLPIFGTNQRYVRAVQQAGGIPVLIPPGDVDCSLALFEQTRGLLLTGGADVDPARYGAEASPKLGGLDPERDELEFARVRQAVERGLPVFGICRGHEVINAALGGTLYQDVPSEYERSLLHASPDRLAGDHVAHTIRPEGGTRLASILGGDERGVNSFHHQGVKELAPGLRASAFSPDGLVEAFESEDGRILALQCHPEEMTALDWARDLFAEFVRAAAS